MRGEGGPCSLTIRALVGDVFFQNGHLKIHHENKKQETKATTKAISLTYMFILMLYLLMMLHTLRAEKD